LDVWEKLKSDILPELLHSLDEGSTLRVWTPGCSTGEEAFSVAMIFQELKEQAKGNFSHGLHVFATDLDKNAIETARRGLFPSTITSEVSAERLKKHFTVEADSYRIRQQVRQMITFAPQNVISDPPFTRLDLLICRNLLIYLEPRLQAKLIPLFHYSLKPGGILLLGSSESIGNSGELFEAAKGKERFFRRLPKASVVCLADFPTFSVGRSPDPPSVSSQTAGPPPDLQLITERLFLNQSLSTAVLCDESGNVLYIHGPSGAYLEPCQGKASMNIFVMIRASLRGSLDVAFATARRQAEAVCVRGLPLTTPHDVSSVNLKVQAFSKESIAQVLGGAYELRSAEEKFPFPLILVLFSRELSGPVGGCDSPPFANRELGQELENALLELQLQRQEAQVSKEELQSGNEELQSLNEELMTSKEEMQSINEELQTVNQELRINMEELSQANDDMKNLLNSTDIATLFLDENLCVRRYTDRTATLFKLKSCDTGRPITDLSSVLVYPELTEDGFQVLESLLPFVRQVSAKDGRSFKASIMPYFTQDNRVDGLVLTFVDMAAVQPQPSSPPSRTP
jgi:two-component system CheB/CheR fusion protein